MPEVVYNKNYAVENVFSEEFNYITNKLKRSIIMESGMTLKDAKNSQVGNAYSHLKETISILEEYPQRIEERIGSILLPPEPKGLDEKKQPEDSPVIFASEINQLRRRVDLVIQRFNEILRRTEL